MPESDADDAPHGSQVAADPPAPTAIDYYALLGVAPDATYDEIRRAFHAAAKRWHPDRFMGASEDEREEAERHMRALIEAHDVLADPPRRALYDAQRTHPAHTAHEHAAEHTRTPPPWQASAEDAEAYDRIYANSDPRGVGSFLGVLLGLVAVAFLRGAFTGGASLGATIALICAILFGFAALWCFVDPASLSRAAERLAPRTPPRPAHAANHQHPAHPKYHPAHEHAHEASPEDEHDAEFERLVEEAVAGIPDEFRQYMRNIMVRVRPQPTAEERRMMHLREHQTLFGLYEGVPLTVQSADGSPLEVITIYQHPIERACHGDPERIREQVRRTVLHEVAHHFGIDHEDMPEWVR